MSMSSEFREFEKFSGRKAVRAAEKSSFSQTCNLLSQYLKEKGSFGDLSFAAGLNCDSEKSPAMDLFPQHVGFGDSKEEVINKNPQLSEIMEPNCKQMTIIYCGKVMVFDEICEEKAKELLRLASLRDPVEEHIRNAIPPHVSGLPIARKASLHRFLEKRKDRINARAPYQLNKSAGSTTTTLEEKTTWLGLASPFL